MANPPAPLKVATPTLANIPPITSVTAPPPVETPKTPAPTATPFLSELEKLTASFGTKEKTSQAETAIASAPYEQQLNQTNTALGTLQADAIARQERITQMGGDTSFQAGESQRIARTDAIEEMRLLSRQAGLQGNIALAEKRAKAAVDLKWEEKTAQIESAKTNIYNNWDTFTDKEKARAKNTLLRLDKDDAFVAASKADEAAIFKIAQTVQEYTGNASDIFEASSPEEAMRLAGSRLQDPTAKFKLESARLDNILKKEEISTAGLRRSLLGEQIKTERAQRAQIGQPTATERKEIAGQTEAAKTAVEVSSSTRDIAKQLQGLLRKGKGNSIIGGSRIFNAGAALPGSNAATVQALYDQLRDSLALGNIDKLKGAMSDKDIEFLRNTASSLRLNLSEKEFDAQLGKIVDRMDAKIIFNTISKEEKSSLTTFFSEPSAFSGSSTQTFSPSSFFTK